MMSKAEAGRRGVRTARVRSSRWAHRGRAAGSWRRDVAKIGLTLALVGSALLTAPAASSADESPETVETFTVTPHVFTYYPGNPIFDDPDNTPYVYVNSSWSGADAIEVPDLGTLPARVLVLTCLAGATTTDDCSGAYQRPEDVEVPQIAPAGGYFAAGASGSQAFYFGVRDWVPIGAPLSAPVDCTVTACAVGITDAFDGIFLESQTLPLDVVVPMTFNGAPAPTSRPDALIGRTATGSFKGDGVYSATVLASQTSKAQVTRATTSTFYVRATNDGSAAGAFRFRGALAQNWSCQVTYFSGTTDVSSQVRDGTFTRTLNPGASKTIRVVIRNTTAGTAGKYCNADVTVRNAGDVVDKVRARVVR